ncbi:jg18527 [Pararge aegeria aegeria]|uniref:glycogenin glucosyltransferase n=1 Tax=Pararge aegeria aegeria TaxID=348720 RepID=A0A8S4S4F6_9NEOP|nr:jg18527 [Pararge aegeria aegeria]
MLYGIENKATPTDIYRSSRTAVLPGCRSVCWKPAARREGTTVVVTATVTHETTPGPKMSNRAWVTLATNDSYGLGALVVAHSLRRSGSVYPAVVLITPSVTDAMRERLRAVFAEVVVVDVLDSKDAAHLALLQRPELGITFTKIHCWNLTQYEKCVFLDADTLIVQNCDELFEREELSAAPDVGWPDCFNSGVFVFTPSAETFNNLIKFASERGSFDGGDQGLLNSYFSDWAQGDINKHLPFLYNVTSAAFYSYIPALKHYGQNLKIIHFIGAAKPWLQQFNWQTRSVDAPEHLREFLQLWWDLFVGQVHSQLDTAMGEVEEELLAILQEETVDFNNPTVEFSYYEPTLDSDSEFPWHHPENQVADPEINVPEINMSEFHNPWDIYVGNIPASKEDFNQNEKKADYYQEIRRHAWDYIHPDQTECHNYQTTFNSSVIIIPLNIKKKFGNPILNLVLIIIKRIYTYTYLLMIIIINNMKHIPNHKTIPIYHNTFQSHFTCTTTTTMILVDLMIITKLLINHITKNLNLMVMYAIRIVFWITIST